jgi:ABC-type transport system substrate-binding protein
MKQATALQISDPGTANSRWAQLDRELTDLAPWVPLSNMQWLDVVSKRVGNYQLNPGVAALRDQLWVR